MHVPRLSALVVAFGLSLVGCGGGGGGGPPPTHSVGGTVSGLSGSGLVLADNGSDHLAITGNGSFTFPTPLANGATYDVSVFEQPGTPAQTCTVTGGTGIVANAAVTSVSVVCLTPPPPVAISPASVNLAAGGSQQFDATVNGTSSTAVTWEVNGIAGGNAATGTISAAGLYTAPVVAGTAVVSALSNANPTDSGQAQIVVLAPHGIGVRTGTDGLAELYDRARGNTFTARGNNYIRLATQTDFGGNTTFYHSTFNVGLYDAARTESALALMQSRAFNTVRVFLNGCCVGSIGDPAGGLSAAYMANVADFLSRAQKHGIYVIFTEDWLPSTGGYDVTCSTPPPSAPQIQDVNAFNLCDGGIAAAQRFHRDFVQSLIAQQAPIGAILAYELRNEYYYDSAYGPLNATSGLVTTANGLTYDMSDAASRQKMMDDGLIYLTNQLRAAIVAVDPTALVTVGFFWPQAPNPTRIGDTRVISVYPAIADSTADLVDIHGYPIPGDLTIDQLMQNYGLVGLQQAKPVVMGEFGAFQNSYALIGDAAAALKAWQIGGCPYHLKGWLLWTWDTAEQSPGLWTDQSGDGSIDLALAPAARPDPCSP